MPITQDSKRDLLHAVELLSPTDFQTFVSEVMAIKARRNRALPAEEAELLKEINEGLPDSLMNRYVPLVEKRKKGSLSSEEHAELIELSDQIEKLEARRVRAMSELAALRKKTLSHVMKELGIKAPAHG
ncbi:MAG: hypothetical protein L0Y72_18325 [Gemmataceae bacterium]|nr:hypothetical protein [Gemmataceae bacterium]MCI0741008.1 hypothetical protein [Gemmataceae bacterium]